MMGVSRCALIQPQLYWAVQSEPIQRLLVCLLLFGRAPNVWWQCRVLIVMRTDRSDDTGKVDEPINGSGEVCESGRLLNG